MELQFGLENGLKQILKLMARVYGPGNTGVYYLSPKILIFMLFMFQLIRKIIQMKQSLIYS